MQGYQDQDYPDQPDPPRGVKVPEEFVKLSERLHPNIDGKLGYTGESRWVMFYYEGTWGGVVWRDASSHGCSMAGMWPFLDAISPLADVYEVNLGSDVTRPTHALVLDRWSRAAYFAPFERALLWTSNARYGPVQG